jgi:hypothetical protein
VGKPRTAAELAIIAGRDDPRLGQWPIELPPKLDGYTGEDPINGRKWSAQISQVIGTSIPYDGATYIIRKTSRAGKTRRSLQYEITCYNANGLVLPGRNPHDVDVPEAAEYDDQMLASESS